MPLYDIDVIITMEGDNATEAWEKVMNFLKSHVDETDVFVGEPHEISTSVRETCGKEFPTPLLAKWHSIQDNLENT